MANKMMNHFILLYSILIIKMSDGYKTKHLTNSTVSGKELRVSIGEIPGGTTIFRNANGTVTGYGGYFYEELLWLARSLNFRCLSDWTARSINMLPTEGANFGTQQINGSYNGMKGKLERKEIDIACSALSGVDGYEIMDLAIYLSATGFSILAPYPVPTTSNFSHVITFSLYVWIGLLLAMIASIGCIYLLVASHQKYLLDNNPSGAGLSSLSDICVYIFATLTNHGGYYRSGGYRSIGMMAFTWCLATFCFVNIYCSCLTSYMSLIFQRPEINSLSDLAAHPHYKLAVVSESIVETFFLEAKSGIMKEIGDKLRNCKASGGGCSLKNFEQTKNKVMEGNFVAFVTTRMAENYMLKTISNSGECLLTTAQGTVFNRYFFMGLQKNSPFSDELNKESLWWHSFGLENYWTKRMLPSAPQCRLKYNSQGQSVNIVDLARLKLKQFYVAFAVLFAGYILSLIQFLRERTIRC